MSLRADALSLAVPGDDGHPRWLVRELSLSIEPGQLWVVVGPNGSGKTTLLRTLAGVRPADEGRVRLDDTDLRDVDPRGRARRIAYLPQPTSLYHDLVVAELVGLGRSPHLSRLAAPGEHDRAAVHEALRRVSAEDLRARRLSTLSGGERQRVMIARMLATDATFLLMDEPTAALDIAHVLSLLALCRTLADDGHAVLVALHDLDLARRHGDRALCLGDPDGMHRHGPTADVLAPDHLSRIFGVRVVEHADGLRFFPA